MLENHLCLKVNILHSVCLISAPCNLLKNYFSCQYLINNDFPELSAKFKAIYQHRFNSCIDIQFLTLKLIIDVHSCL